MIKPSYIKVDAEVRHWGNATINGIADENGDKTPLRNGDNWCPIISLHKGVIQDWPKGTTADIQFKVCDAGEYFLLDEQMKPIAKLKDDYVPSFLSVGDDSYGDYIILQIDSEGSISDWNAPLIGEHEWIIV